MLVSRATDPSRITTPLATRLLAAGDRVRLVPPPRTHERRDPDRGGCHRARSATAHLAADHATRCTNVDVVRGRPAPQALVTSKGRSFEEDGNHQPGLGMNDPTGVQVITTRALVLVRQHTLPSAVFRDLRDDQIAPWLYPLAPTK